MKTPDVYRPEQNGKGKRCFHAGHLTKPQNEGLTNTGRRKTKTSGLGLMPPCIIGSFVNDIVAVESGLGGCVADRCETPDLGKKDDDTAAEFCERKGAQKQILKSCRR